MRSPLGCASALLAVLDDTVFGVKPMLFLRATVISYSSTRRWLRTRTRDQLAACAFATLPAT